MPAGVAGVPSFATCVFYELTFMPLSGLCRLFLPRGADTELLRACLWNEDAVQSAFAAWRRSSQYSAMQSGGGAKRRLLPLLCASLQRASVTIPTELRALLRAGQMYEELRTRAYREIAAAVLARLGAAEVPFLARGGVSFAISLYGNDEFRHCHDIDLLVSEDSLAVVSAVLEGQCEFKLEDAAPGKRRDWVLYHVSGLPIVLHCDSQRIPAYECSWAELKKRAVVQQGYSTEFETLSPEDSLLQVILLAASAEQESSLIWLCDAWKLATSGTLDWARLVEEARDRSIIVPVLYAVEYLGGELQAPIPANVLEELQSSMLHLSAAEKRGAEEVLLYGLQKSFPGGRKALLRQTKGLRVRILLLSCFLFPSAAALQAVGQIKSSGDVLRYWAVRIVRGLLRLLKNQIRQGGDTAVAEQKNEPA
jgi:Uncharacterised nucleotidyltransferase